MTADTIQRRSLAVLMLIPALAMLILLGAGCSKQEATAPQEPAAPATAMAPEKTMAPENAAPEAAPPVEAAKPAAEAAGTQVAAADGQKTYETTCQACHTAGVAGAPKFGDKAAWAPRIAKGNDALLSSVKNGLNAMPPKGTCMTCSDDDLRAAIAYMVEQGS